MFKWISGLKIWAIVGGLVLSMWVVIKHLLASNRKLKHDAKINDEIKSIHEQQEIDESEAIKNEKIEIKKETNVRAKLSKRERFNKL